MHIDANTGEKVAVVRRCGRGLVIVRRIRDKKVYAASESDLRELLPKKK